MPGAKGFMHVVEGMARAIDGWKDLGEYVSSVFPPQPSASD
jgi:hypothetical protein